MIRTFSLALLGLGFAFGTPQAAPCTVTNSFTSDSTASAGDVNQNFTDVLNCINDLPPATSVPAGTVVPFAGFILPTGFLWANGAAVSRTTYSALWGAVGKTLSGVTITTIASPGVVTWSAHGFSNGWPVKFATTGALPTGITAGTTYYVQSAATNTFQLSTTPSGASLNTSGSQSGTQTGIFAPYGDGDGSSTFNLPDLRGRGPFGLDNLGGASAAGRVTAAGSGINGTTPAASGGEQAHTLTQAELPAVPLLLGYPISSDGGMAVFTLGTPGPSPVYSGNIGSGSAHNTMPPALMTNYIIKY
jgi:microcystin-dependent protein